MRHTNGTGKSPGEKIVKDIKRATRKQYSSEEKIRIVLDGLRGEAKAPSLMASHGIATLTIAEMLILVGDNPSRIRSEAALAKLLRGMPDPSV